MLLFTIIAKKISYNHLNNMTKIDSLIESLAQTCKEKNDMLITDINDEKSLPRLYEYNLSCTLLDEAIEKYFLSFTMSDLVYTYAKQLCERKIKFENWYRTYGFGYHDRIKAYKEYGGNINRLAKHISDGKFVLSEI